MIESLNLSQKQELTMALLEKKRREIKVNPWQLAKILYPDYDFKDFHEEWFNLGLYDEDEEDLCLGPRNFAKTTVRAVIRTILRIIENPNVQVGICSDTNDQSVHFARETKMHLERNVLLRQLYPYLAPGTPWTEGEFNVIGADKIKKTATVTALSYGKSITGLDFDDLTIDDIVDFDNSRTKYQRDKVHDWIGMTLFPMMKKNGKIHWNGSRYHQDDEYNKLLKGNIRTNVNTHRAIIDEKTVLWPEMFSMKWLLDRKDRLGSIIFNSQWQNDTKLMAIGKIFHRDWFKHFSKTQQGDFKTDDGLIRFNYSDLAIYQTCDLAISKSETAHYFVILTYGIDKEGNFFVFDIRRGRYSWNEQKTLSRSNYVLWKIRAGLRWMGIEGNQYQRVLGDEINVFPDMSIRNLDADKDKVTRAMPMSAKYESGKVYHNAEMEILEVFEDELCSFNDGEFDDMVDCVAYMPRCATREKTEVRVR